MDQHDRHYSTTQDAVTHAGKLWHTLDQEKILREIKEDKDRARKRYHDSGRPNRRSNTRNNNFSQPQGQTDEQRGSQQGLQQGLRRDRSSRSNCNDNRGSEPRLTNEEHEHHLNNGLCFNCGCPGHSIGGCTHPYNPNRVPPKMTTKPNPSHSERLGRPEVVGHGTEV